MIAALEDAFPATEHYVGDDGRHYWRLPSRAVAPLLTPSAEELVSLKSAITELERVDMNGEAIQLRRLERKVRALIPSDRTLRLTTDEEALLEAMGFAARPGPRPSMNEAVDLAISEALKGPFELRICYQGRGDAKPSWRTIEPLGLLLGSRRYLVGIDTAKRDGRYRHYRVEDIMEARVQTRIFTYPVEFDLGEYAKRAFGSYHHEAEYGEVVWKFAPEAAERAARFQFHPNQEAERMDDGSLLVRFDASGHLEMCWHLYAWGESVEVITPPRLAELVHPYRRSDFAALP
ncbi:WYL domain-containing protein [Qipengyuania sp. 6D47A]|uniref:WYL domain-containing protein n=2 Tax=Qipengyuania qiaonensis TaxID=2867240 RepID=A0ABS7J874_9SPHN|nr:WYL domain-containing protein [Qipengyuania qiaonensis]